MVLFVVVVIAASLCALTSLGLAVLAHRLDQAELAIVSAFFFAGSVLPLVHGLLTPGVLFVEAAASMTAVFLAVPTGLLAAVIVARAIAIAPSAWRLTLAAVDLAVLGLAVVLLALPDLALSPTAGSPAGIAYGLSAFGATTALGLRHVRLAVVAERAGPAVVAAGYVLVGASTLLFLGASPWSLYFWVAHVVDVAGVFAATVGGLLVYRRHGNVYDVLGPITALDSRRAFETGLSPLVHRFVADLEAKDRMTRDHVIRTGALAIDVANQLRLPPEEVRRCGLVGVLHDVGKLEIPDEVLTKPGRLTDDEFVMMKSHAGIGAAMVEATLTLADLAPGVRAHHERVDGNGYPDKLSGADIPLVSRVVSVCDSYDAMTFTRHYRKGMDAEKVRSILSEHAGSQWDPEVVRALLIVVENRADRTVWALDDVGRSGRGGTDSSDQDGSAGTTVGCHCLPAELLETVN